MIEPISVVAEIGIKDVEIGLVRFRMATALRAVLDFKVPIRSGRPCDERVGVAGAVALALMRKASCMKAKPSGGWKALAFLATLSAAGPMDAEADMLWNWSYVNADTNITAGGTLTTKDLAADSYVVTAITGVWNGAAIKSLEAAYSCCSPPGWNNNLLLAGNPKLDKGGFAFDVSGGSKINLFYRHGRYAYEIQKWPRNIRRRFRRHAERHELT